MAFEEHAFLLSWIKNTISDIAKVMIILAKISKDSPPPIVARYYLLRFILFVDAIVKIKFRILRVLRVYERLEKEQ